MPNMYDNSSESDEELAEMTDRLLAGLDVEASARNQDQARVVKQIHQMLSSEPSPGALYRARLTQRLNEEWDRIYRQQPRPFFARPVVRFAALAASLAAVVGVGLLAILNSETAGKGMTGTALGPLSAVFPVLVIAGIMIIVLALWSRRR